MKQRKPKKLTIRMKGLLTLLTDKINYHGALMGVHHNSNWNTNITDSGAVRIQGVLDRIERVEYFKCLIIDPKDCFNYLGDEFYDHDIHFYWKELFGKGKEDVSESLKTVCLQDKIGRWHFSCDTGMWIKLWHPYNQSLQEHVSGCYNIIQRPNWRPAYNYTKDEVIEALKIMCETFKWDFKYGEKIKWNPHLSW